jgi:hypothetical protein
MTKIYIFYLSFVLVILLTTMAIGKSLLFSNSIEGNTFQIQYSIEATKTWIGNTNEWNSNSNWSPSGVPGTRDDINIPTSPIGGNMPIISSGNFSIRRLIISSGAELNQTGGTLNTNGDINIIGSFIQTSGTLNTNRSQTDVEGGSMIIEGTFSGNDVNVTSNGSVNVSGTFSTNDNKITIDAGTFLQSGGIVSTKDMELKNGGVYNQTSGELQIAHDLKIPTGTTFNSTAGTVRFTGNQGGGADYSGNVQFYNVVIEAGGNFNMNKDTDNILIAGNFTNYNPNLDNNKGTLTFNGTSPQTIYSVSNPAATRTLANNLIINNSAGVSLVSELGIQTGFFYNSNGFLATNNFNFYVNGVLYDGPLPVELSSFSASVAGNAVKLNWKTETEVNNYGFEVERKILKQVQNDSPVWEKIGFVNGNGNSNSPKNYSYEDKNVSAGKYSYRLKQIDNDGQFEFSKTIEVDLGAPKKFELSQNYPNPFNPTTTIRFSLPEASTVKLTIYNILGQEIKTLLNEFKESGIHSLNFNASELNSGMYIYKLEAGTYTQSRKMMLVK